MCLILFAYKIHPVFNLVLAANRDEFYNRATRPLGFWSDREHLLAGRDLRGGGTWLGVTRSGRFAAITNYRDPASLKDKAPSRGLLLSAFLSSAMPAGEFLNEIRVDGPLFNGFNLLVGDAEGLYYYSNRGNGVVKLPPGLYGLSNHLLDTAWPKVERGKQKLELLLRKERDIQPESLFQLLHDRTAPLPEQLPDTGIGPRWEKRLGPLFIVSGNYGTRSSSVLLMSSSGRISVSERTFHPARIGISTTSTRMFHFSVNGGRGGSRTALAGS
ncbi:MAG: NRDE family protein [Pseudomonadota bacterium]